MKRSNRIGALSAAIAVMAVVGCASTSTRESTGQYLDDSAITAKVKAAIFDNSSLKSDEIKVDTFKGRVQLSGFVRSRANIHEAIVVAQRVNGVSSVKNDMQLK